MLRLDDPGISTPTRRQLRNTQDDIDAQPTFDEQVSRAKDHWRNRTNNQAFTEIRRQLSVMCREIGRCGYCEDSESYQIEHIAPKNYYPDRAFVWENFLYVCGKCNTPKRDHYAVFRSVDGLEVHQHEFRGRPPAGDPLLINPREEDPMEHLWLDLNNFAFTETSLDDDESFRRADYTLRVLHLNRRDKLVKARQIAYKSYLAHLRHYVQDKTSGTYEQTHLDNIERTIRESPHPTVWREMQRQHSLIYPDDTPVYPTLHRLFTAAPEALTW
jgi:uncharacterized protein (TIGR02646 family)